MARTRRWSAAEQRYTYASLRNEVRAFAKGLHALGVRKGDKIAILMGNKPEWIIADLAICLIGGIMVAVNTWVTTRELQHILSHSDSTMLIASDRYLKYDYFAMLEELEPLAQSMPLLKRVVHVGTRPYRDSISFAEMFARGRDVADATIDAARTPSTRKTSPTFSTPPARPRHRRACSSSTTR